MDYLKEINAKFPIRKTEDQKEAFRKYAIQTAKANGTDARTEKLDSNNNVVIGDPTTAKTIFTAHYDTPCRALFPNLMLPRNKGLFYLYQYSIIVLFVIVALIPAITIGLNVLESNVIYALIFFTLYFGLFLLCFKTFTNKHNANDNTSGVATIFSMIEKLSSDELKEVAFILFDNEEKGLKGAKAYNKAHKTQMQDKLLINFDCVANGKNILFIAKPNAEKNQLYVLLKESFLSSNDFSVEFYSLAGSVSNSDYKKFEQGVCCVACKKSKRGILYTPYIHTAKDVVADSKNIEFLTSCACKYVAKLAKNDKRGD